MRHEPSCAHDNPKNHPTRKDWRHNCALSGTNSSYHKNRANRKARRAKGLYQGNSYRKLYDRYDINDFK